MRGFSEKHKIIFPICLNQKKYVLFILKKFKKNLNYEQITIFRNESRRNDGYV